MIGDTSGGGATEQQHATRMGQAMDENAMRWLGALLHASRHYKLDSTTDGGGHIYGGGYLKSEILLYSPVCESYYHPIILLLLYCYLKYFRYLPHIDMTFDHTHVSFRRNRIPLTWFSSGPRNVGIETLVALSDNSCIIIHSKTFLSLRLQLDHEPGGHLHPSLHKVLSMEIRLAVVALFTLGTGSKSHNRKVPQPDLWTLLRRNVSFDPAHFSLLLE